MQNQEVTNVEAKASKNEAIPFPKRYSQLNDAAMKTAKADIQKLASAENLTVDLINKLVPTLIEHVLGGGNVVVINDLLKACKADRRKQVFLFLCRHLAHEENRETMRFGKRCNDGKAKGRTDRYEEFKATGQTVMVWCNQNNKTEPVEFKPEQKAANFVRTMFKHGVDTDQLLALLTSAIEKESEKAKAA